MKNEIAIIGCGRIGSVHARAITETLPMVDLVLADVEPSRAIDLANRVGAHAVDIADIWDRPNLRAVAICAVARGVGSSRVCMCRKGCPPKAFALADRFTSDTSPTAHRSRSEASASAREAKSEQSVAGQACNKPVPVLAPALATRSADIGLRHDCEHSQVATRNPPPTDMHVC